MSAARSTRFVAAGIALLAAALASALTGCGSARVAGERQVGVAPVTAPVMVYVMDFELDAVNVRAQRGILPPPPPASLGLGNVLPPLPGATLDPAVRARQVVDLMSKSLVAELSERGVAVRRLGPREPLPADGWVVRGVFTSVNEGNQLQRAVIGFGAGQTDVQVLVSIDDLARGTPKPIYELDTKADSGKLPGAVITLNPYVAAARFVLSGKDVDRSVKQTAEQVAEHTAQRLREAQGSGKPAVAPRMASMNVSSVVSVAPAEFVADSGDSTASCSVTSPLAGFTPVSAQPTRRPRVISVSAGVTLQ